MILSSLSIIRHLTVYHFLILLFVPHTLSAMDQKDVPSSSITFPNEFQIRAIASFKAHTEPHEKSFCRYVVPYSMSHDADGNVLEVDVRSISVRTNAKAPMFIITLAPLAINLKTRLLKVACTTYTNTKAVNRQL
jgi:hypothetical protein